MKVPLEITYRGTDKTAAIDTLIHEKIAKLEQVCDYINSCHIAVEKVHDRPKSGSPYRVRIDLTVPPGHEIVAESNPGEGNQYDPLDAVIRHAFDAARRQLHDLKTQQQEADQAQSFATQDDIALVIRLFPEDGYGFLKTPIGEEIYFHQNSVLHDDFERLEVGTGVRFFAQEGDQGPQASTVQVIDKPGERVGKSEQDLIEPPLGWSE